MVQAPAASMPAVGMEVPGAPLPAAVAGAEQSAVPVNPQAMAEPTWPCPKCGTLVPMSLDHCTVCGAGFLADARGGNSIKVPVFGEVGQLTTGRKVMIGVVLTLAVMVVLLLLATIGGKLL
jgi:hypothetical protein